MVKDRTCIFSVDFDCKKRKPYDGKGAVQCEKTPTKKCYDTPRKVPTHCLVIRPLCGGNPGCESCTGTRR